jgi:hypothetical protein
LVYISKNQRLHYSTAIFHDKTYGLKALATIYWDFAQFFANPAADWGEKLQCATVQVSSKGMKPTAASVRKMDHSG